MLGQSEWRIEWERDILNVRSLPFLTFCLFWFQEFKWRFLSELARVIIDSVFFTISHRFLNTYAYYFQDLFSLYEKTDLQRTWILKERSPTSRLTPQVVAMAGAEPIWSQEPVLNLPWECVVPRLWAICCSFSQASNRELDGKWSSWNMIWYPYEILMHARQGFIF